MSPTKKNAGDLLPSRAFLHKAGQERPRAGTEERHARLGGRGREVVGQGCLPEGRGVYVHLILSRWFLDNLRQYVELRRESDGIYWDPPARRRPEDPPPHPAAACFLPLPTSPLPLPLPNLANLRASMPLNPSASQNTTNRCAGNRDGERHARQGPEARDRPRGRRRQHAQGGGAHHHLRHGVLEPEAVRPRRRVRRRLDREGRVAAARLGLRHPGRGAQDQERLHQVGYPPPCVPMCV